MPHLPQKDHSRQERTHTTAVATRQPQSGNDHSVSTGRVAYTVRQDPDTHMKHYYHHDEKNGTTAYGYSYDSRKDPRHRNDDGRVFIQQSSYTMRGPSTGRVLRGERLQHRQPVVEEICSRAGNETAASPEERRTTDTTRRSIHPSPGNSLSVSHPSVEEPLSDDEQNEHHRHRSTSLSRGNHPVASLSTAFDSQGLMPSSFDSFGRVNFMMEDMRSAMARMHEMHRRAFADMGGGGFLTGRGGGGRSSFVEWPFI